MGKHKGPGEWVTNDPNIAAKLSRTDNAYVEMRARMVVLGDVERDRAYRIAVEEPT